MEKTGQGIDKSSRKEVIWKGVPRGGVGLVREDILEDCRLNQNLKMSRKEPDGKEEEEENSGITLAFMPRHASAG